MSPHIIFGHGQPAPFTDTYACTASDECGDNLVDATAGAPLPPCPSCGDAAWLPVDDVDMMRDMDGGTHSQEAGAGAA